MWSHFGSPVDAEAGGVVGEQVDDEANDARGEHHVRHKANVFPGEVDAEQLQRLFVQEKAVHKAAEGIAERQTDERRALGDEQSAEQIADRVKDALERFARDLSANP